MKSQVIPFSDWLASISRDRITGWRWRRDGLINTINIHGRLYIHHDEIRRFEKRAIEGEFARDHKPLSPG